MALELRPAGTHRPQGKIFQLTGAANRLFPYWAMAVLPFMGGLDFPELEKTARLRLGGLVQDGRKNGIKVASKDSKAGKAIIKGV
jgi:hypothetical protein